MDDNGGDWIFPQRDGSDAALRLGYIATQAIQFQDTLDELRRCPRPGPDGDVTALLDQAAAAARDLAESVTRAAHALAPPR